LISVVRVASQMVSNEMGLSIITIDDDRNFELREISEQQAGNELECFYQPLSLLFFDYVLLQNQTELL
jgi:hypothetical protein